MNKIMKAIAIAIPVALTAGTLVMVSGSFAQDSEQVDRAAFARGAKAWSENCGRCHNIRAPAELSDEEWMVSVTHMRVRANISGDVARDIITFLQASN